MYAVAAIKRTSGEYSYCGGDSMKKRLEMIAKRLPVVAATVGAAVLIVALPGYSAEGVKRGLYLCAANVVPSLFPFCVVSVFFVRSGLCGYVGKLLERPTKMLFNLPGCAGGAVCMSLIAGYPVGVNMTYEMLSKGQISRSDAQRMTLFCLNSGPAFVIGTVGNGMLGSTRAGVILLVSLTLSSLTLGILTGFMPHGEGNGTLETEPVVISGALPEAVMQGTKNIISICAWVVLFSCALEYIPLLSLPDWAELLLCCAAEVTGGCSRAAGVLNIPAIAAVLGWGGVSVHCQVMRQVRECQTPVSQFVCARFLCAALAAIYCGILLKFFPCTVGAVSTVNHATPQLFSFSAPAAAAMLISGVLLILELDKDGKKC